MKTPDFHDALLSFKQFVMIQEENVAPELVTQSYETYKTEYFDFHAKETFERFKSSAFMKERYQPELHNKFITFSKSDKKEKGARLAALIDEKFLSVPIFTEDVPSGDSISATNEIRVDPEKKEAFQLFNPFHNSLVIPNIPLKISIWDLHDHFKAASGLVEIHISDPVDYEPYCRTAYLQFTSEDLWEHACRQFHGTKVRDIFDVELIKGSTDTSTHCECLPAHMNTDERIAQDVQVSANLIRELDVKWGLYDETEEPADPHPVLESEHELDKRLPQQQLDLQILYLRFVHSVCYYKGTVHKDSLTAWSKEGIGPVRLMGRTEQDPKDANFGDQLDEKLRNILDNTESVELRPELSESEEPVKSKWDEYCKEYSTNVGDERWRCGLCKKMFKAEIFVHKHLRNKHESALNDIKYEVYIPIMRVDYINDPRKIVFLPARKIRESAVVHSGNDRNSGQRYGNSPTHGPVRRRGGFRSGRHDGGGRLPYSHHRNYRHAHSIPPGYGSNDRPPPNYEMSYVPPPRPYLDRDAPKQNDQSSQLNVRALLTYDDL